MFLDVSIVSNVKIDENKAKEKPEELDEIAKKIMVIYDYFFNFNG